MQNWLFWLNILSNTHLYVYGPGNCISKKKRLIQVSGLYEFDQRFSFLQRQADGGQLPDGKVSPKVLSAVLIPA